MGQEYKAHFDFFSSTDKLGSNPRISTLVMYLNDVEHGGEFFFLSFIFQYDAIVLALNLGIFALTLIGVIIAIMTSWTQKK